VPAPTDSPLRTRLARPRAQADLVAEQVRHGRELLELSTERSAGELRADYDQWHDYNKRLLRFLLASDEVSETYLRSAYGRLLAEDMRPEADMAESVRRELAEIESVVNLLGLAGDQGASQPTPRREPAGGRRILVVYGRNEAVKEKVARFLMKLGLEPVLLDERAACGRTLIEKLEGESRVAFAVVLLTADDVGALASQSHDLRPRARQNVILELGLSLGKLTRRRVCALYEAGVELPSDFHGVEYTSVDAAGAWRAKLARELHEVGLRFDPMKAL
jgi:predicted nucleotide-binding protein